MPPEAFFSTTAQTLPALLIAFAVEAGVLLRDPLNGWRQRVRVSYAHMYQAIEGGGDQQTFERWIHAVLADQKTGLRSQLMFLSYVVLLLITIGEIAATLVLFLEQPGNWFTDLAGMVCVVAMTFGTAIVAAVPVVRLQLETRLPVKSAPPRPSLFPIRIVSRREPQAHWRRGVGHLVIGGVPVPRRRPD